ncbi:MAG: acyl-CoA mutase large subunit family protein [Bacteroidales bacterium]|nr:acyl-CoA mutase large subunit family protein [Bacteroidales bacterium]
MKNNRLFAEFPETTREEWEAQLKKDLKGADYDKTLFSNSREGIKIHPFYRQDNPKETQLADQAPGQFPYLRGNKTDNNWLIRQDILVDTIKKANEKAKSITSKGVNSIGFLFSDQDQPTVKEIEMLMENIHAEKIEVNFMCGAASHKVVAIYEELVEHYQRDTNKIQGSVDFDPLMAYTFKGKFCQTEEYAFKHAKQLVYAAESMPNFRVLAVHGVNLRNAGANAVQELAFSIAQGVEYIHRLSDLGLTVDKIAPRIKFNLGVGSNYFMEIAKLRAARYLWSKALIAFGLKDKGLAKMNIHSTSISWNKTIYDPHVNILRNSTEGMSAILGGTDSLCLSPFDMHFKIPSDFSERIARNQQHLFKEESFLDKVVDPAAGSYYLESLTHSLVTESWKLFLQVEDLGGYIAALREGFVQEEIENAAQKSRQEMATRKEIILGSNQYPNFTERINKMLNPDFFEDLDLSCSQPEIKTLKQARLSQEIEKIRHRTDLFSQKEARPKVFMLPLGNKSMRKIRAQFACNYFACAGFEVEDNNGFDSVSEGVQAAFNSKADIVVICSSDAEYPIFAEEVLVRIKSHAITVVAGYPKALIEEIKASGISHFIHAKSNIVEDLKKYQQLLGIE